MLVNRRLGSSGSLKTKVIRAPRPVRVGKQKQAKWTMWNIIQHAFPWFGQPKEVFRWRIHNFRRVLLPMFKIVLANLLKIPTVIGSVSLTVIRADGIRIPYGLAGLKVVTTAGAGFIVDAFQDSVELELMRYHGIGTGTTSEAVGDTALETELTTQYDSDNTRATGTQTENGANVYETVGTNTVDASVAATEHGILTQAAVGGGVLLDRTVFSVINLGSGDSLQTTYNFTVNTGG